MIEAPIPSPEEAPVICLLLALFVLGWLFGRIKERNPKVRMFFVNLQTFLEKCFGSTLFFFAAVVCSLIGLGAIAFFGYGAWLGVVMFFTLAPVSILAGLVLFLVSVLIGFGVVMACLASALISWGKCGCSFTLKIHPIQSPDVATSCFLWCPRRCLAHSIRLASP